MSRRAREPSEDDEEEQEAKRTRREQAIAEAVAAGYNWLNMDEPSVPDDIRLELFEYLRPVDMDKLVILLSQSSAPQGTTTTSFERYTQRVAVFMEAMWYRLFHRTYRSDVGDQQPYKFVRNFDLLYERMGTDGTRPRNFWQRAFAAAGFYVNVVGNAVVTAMQDAFRIEPLTFEHYGEQARAWEDVFTSDEWEDERPIFITLPTGSYLRLVARVADFTAAEERSENLVITFNGFTSDGFPGEYRTLKEKPQPVTWRLHWRPRPWNGDDDRTGLSRGPATQTCVEATGLSGERMDFKWQNKVLFRARILEVLDTNTAFYSDRVVYATAIDLDAALDYLHEVTGTLSSVGYHQDVTLPLPLHSLVDGLVEHGLRIDPVGPIPRSDWLLRVFVVIEQIKDQELVFGSAFALVNAVDYSGLPRLGSDFRHAPRFRGTDWPMLFHFCCLSWEDFMALESVEPDAPDTELLYATSMDMFMQVPDDPNVLDNIRNYYPRQERIGSERDGMIAYQKQAKDAQ
jgi:hypothetical protein